MCIPKNRLTYYLNVFLWTPGSHRTIQPNHAVCYHTAQLQWRIRLKTFLSRKKDLLKFSDRKGQHSQVKDRITGVDHASNFGLENSKAIIRIKLHVVPVAARETSILYCVAPLRHLQQTATRSFWRLLQPPGEVWQKRKKKPSQIWLHVEFSVHGKKSWLLSTEKSIPQESDCLSCQFVFLGRHFWPKKQTKGSYLKEPWRTAIAKLNEQKKLELLPVFPGRPISRQFDSSASPEKKETRSGEFLSRQNVLSLILNCMRARTSMRWRKRVYCQ